MLGFEWDFPLRNLAMAAAHISIGVRTLNCLNLFLFQIHAVFNHGRHLQGYQRLMSVVCFWLAHPTIFQALSACSEKMKDAILGNSSRAELDVSAFFSVWRSFLFIFLCSFYRFSMELSSWIQFSEFTVIGRHLFFLQYHRIFLWCSLISIFILMDMMVSDFPF